MPHATRSRAKPCNRALPLLRREPAPTGLSYERWRELLLRSRGASYWLTLATGRRTGDKNIHRIVDIFPDFDPASMSPTTPYEEIDTDG